MFCNRKKIKELEDRIRLLERPFKFQIGDVVTVGYSKKEFIVCSREQSPKRNWYEMVVEGFRDTLCYGEESLTKIR